MMKNILAIAAMLLVFASAISVGGSITYTQDGTPILTYGTAAGGTSITNINADDASYYIVNAVTAAPSVMVTNPDMNGNVNSWTNGVAGDKAPTTNTWTYSTSTYNSSPGSGNKEIRYASPGSATFAAGCAHQAPTSTVDQTTTNYLNWAMKYNSQTVGAATGLGICGAVNLTVAGTANRCIYWCWLTSGTLPANTTEVYFIGLGSGTGTTWQSFSKDIGSQVEALWGAGVSYTIDRVAAVSFLSRGSGSASTIILDANYDDIYLTKQSGYLIDLQHKSQASVGAPAGRTLMRVTVSDKFYSSSGTPTYQMQWWNTNTAGWANCGSAASQGSESARTCDTSTNPSYYINAGDSSKMAMRLYTNTPAATFSSNENYLYYKIWYPNITSTANPAANTTTPYVNDLIQVNCTSSVDSDYGIADANYTLYYSTDGGTNWNPITTGSSNLTLDGSTPTNPLTAQSIPIGSSATKTWLVNATTAGTTQIKCGTASASAGRVNSTTPLSITAGSPTITSATLSAPTTNPDINTGQTFLLNVTVSCSSGACANVVVYPRYCSGSLACTPNADITTVTSGLTSNVNSISLGTVNAGAPQTASFTITGAANNTYTVGGRFTSTPNSGTATGTQGVTVMSPAALTSVIGAAPASVGNGDTITVTMNVTNTGQRQANTVAPSALTLTLTGTAGATFVEGPSPTSAGIAGGAMQQFTWTYTAVSGISGGTVNFTGNASGTDAKTGGAISSTSTTSNNVTVAGIPVTSANVVQPATDPDINTGQTFTLQINVSCSNSGSGTCGPVTVFPRYCSGSLTCTPNTNLTTGSSGLTSNINTYTTAALAKNSFILVNFTVTGVANNTYNVSANFASNSPATGSATNPRGVTVRSPAALTAAIGAAPSIVYDGENITVTMTVNNTGTRAAINVTPSALTVNVINGTASATLLTGPSPAMANISGLATQSFTWTYNASSGADGGNITFSGNASGKDNKTGATITSNHNTSNVVEVRLRGTNLSIWDETDAGLPYANMTKYAGDAVSFYANYTNSSNNVSLSTATCQISIYNGTAWTAWAGMAWTAGISLFKYNYTSGFTTNGTYGWNVTCNQTGHQRRNATNTTVISPRTANLTIWNDAPKCIDDQVYFYANYTMGNGTTINGNGTCRVSFNITGGWTAWVNMTFQNASAPYIYNRSFTVNGTYDWNVTCNGTNYEQKNETGNFTIAANSSLTIWDDTDSVPKYLNDQVYFYANYTMDNGTIIDTNASCNISFNVSGGWTGWENMTYNGTSHPYHYNRSFATNGTFNWNVTCFQCGYRPQNATSTFTIAVLTATVRTSKQNYNACLATVYYRVRLYNSTNSLIDANFTAKMTDAGGTVMQNAAAYPNNGTGVYLGNYPINTVSTPGTWLLRAMVGSLVEGTATFGVNP